jgi:hypothetical protein
MLNIFFVPIKLINFDFCPYTKKKSHIFIPKKFFNDEEDLNKV